MKNMFKKVDNRKTINTKNKHDINYKLLSFNSCKVLQNKIFRKKTHF